MLLIIGDPIKDCYVEYETVRPCPEGDWPIIREVNRWTQGGGVFAVAEMVRAFGDHHACRVGDYDEMTTKTRVIIDSTTVHRIDDDRTMLPVFPDRDGDGQVCCVADYGRGSVDRNTIQACLDRGWRVIVDPHPSQDPAIYAGVYGITPNRAENQKHGYAMRTSEWPRICQKQDRDGMVAIEGSKNLILPSTIEQPPLDVTGCGDMVLATIGVMLSRGLSWLESCEIANFAAGLACGHRGASPLEPDEIKQVEAMQTSISTKRPETVQ